ncbi:hypothetical protein CDEF62S_00645 [Castellaniella defragrans]
MWLKKLMRWTITLCIVAFAAGCAVPGGDYCDIARPIWWNSSQEMEATPASIVRQVVKQNEAWAALCSKDKSPLATNVGHGR